ncbi:uncharacterized protein G6M90_00g104370 [Metarhizium brunneum]|uniref:Amine oxidase domain-containing protein n=1 Tax=Metarhizium brunneum TaxID=500148 RepID=A0A7D5V2F6_9HYPO
MSLDQGSNLSLRDQWASQHAVRGIKEEFVRLRSDNIRHEPSLPEDPRMFDIEDPYLPPAPKPHDTPKVPPKERLVIPLGIVGAGVAGLFAAKVLDYLNWKLFHMAAKSGGSQSGSPTNMDEFQRQYDLVERFPNTLCFTYTIHEAAQHDRVGGRLYTHNFGGPRKAHDYYDVGAMRFPDNPVMARTFALFKTLGMKMTDLKTHPDAPDGSIIPYYMTNGDEHSRTVEPWCFNDITLWGTYSSIVSDDSDPFKISTDNTIPKILLKNPPDQVMNASIEPLREALRRDAKQDPPGREGWNLLMQYDKFSTRQFLGIGGSKPSPGSPIPPPPYNYETIEWMETFNGGTNWYDQAFSETVLESLDFEYDTQHKDWFCILGGAQQLSKILESKITRKPHYGNRVTKITAKGPMEVEIQVDTPHGKKTKCQYKGLVNTTTLGCMRQMDISRAGLNYATKQALRSLGYGPSSKVAIKFKRAWWIHDLGTHGIKMGGLGYSDLSIRTCVYPSYNIYDDADGTAVLLCSYTWQQDAERIGALLSSHPEPEKKVAEEAELKELLLRDLARLHRSEHMPEEELYKLVKDNYITHHAHAWGSDPNTAGAFAFFRPQQFTKMWNKMIHPSGDVVIAGEAASPHHAWVVGALESVIHGLHAWMAENVSLVPALSFAMAILERNEPGNPFVGLPPYMTPDISKWQGDLGRRHRSRCLDPTRKPGGV